ncbi:hypothetical protein IPL68_03725 [Candidatus Saccharibacteria bacterium]|nr:MAG: hypothetical protein IPL68_03725 [Candidatus Saccharibacteria bacterium]
MSDTKAQKTEDTAPPKDGSDDYKIVTSDGVSAKKSGLLQWSPKKKILALVFLLLVVLPWLGAYWTINYKRTTARDVSQVMDALTSSLSGGSSDTKSGVTPTPYQPAGYTFSVLPTNYSAIEYKVPTDKLEKHTIRHDTYCTCRD